MKWPVYIGLGVAVAILLAIVVYVLVSTRGTGTPAEEAASYAPDFTLPTASGELITLSDVRAPLRIVNFWASWSPYARDELPALVRLKKALGDKIEILALNRDANPAEGRAFLESLGLGSELTFVYDTDDTYYKKVVGFAMPETLFVGEGGVILDHQRGPLTEAELKRKAEELLSIGTH